jgi:hypothetical protein
VFGLEVGDGEHREAEDDAGGGEWGEGEGEALPGQVFGFEQSGGEGRADQQQAAEQEAAAEQVAEYQRAIEPGEQVAGFRVVGEQPPRHVVVEQGEVIVVDQPFGGGQFGAEQPGAECPLEGGGGNAEDAIDERQRIRRLGRVVEIEDFG